MLLDRLRTNADAVRRRIADACRAAGRAPDSLTIIAVTKSVGPEACNALVRLGFRDLGENRAVEAVQKIAQVQEPVRWHFIGHLQTNKAKKVLDHFVSIHSVDRAELATELEKRLAPANRRLECFIEVNSGEASKGGVDPKAAVAFVEWLRKDCPHLDLRGFMTMAPNVEPEQTRPHFRRLRQLAAEAGLPGLSMGMSNDFEVAIQEGATHVRIGTAFFEGIGEAQ